MHSNFATFSNGAVLEPQARRTQWTAPLAVAMGSAVGAALFVMVASGPQQAAYTAQSTTTATPPTLMRTGYSSRPDTRALPPSTYAARAPALAAASDADDRAPVPQGAPAGTQPHVLWSWVLLLGVPLAWALYGLRRGLLGASPTPVSLHAVAVNAETEEEFDARKFRRSLNKTGRYSRKLQKLPESVEQMEEDGVGYSRTGLVAQMRTGDFKFAVGDVTVELAEAYGFCWGVERAVQMAYEARKTFPDSKIHVTNEIIHNPTVNNRLLEMDMSIMETTTDAKSFAGLGEGDVAVLPAFGASVQEMQALNDKKVQIVDTTCPWVSKVWNAVGSQKDADHTSIVHGKWAHEETVATVSFAGKYLVVKDMEQAEYLANYILNGGDKDEFLKYYGAEAMSAGFDPEAMLDKIGLANQTTMLKGETVAIGKLLESTMMQKFGPQNLNEHYMVMDTICDATQERQDAMYKMMETASEYDLMLVVGGFNSSNTSHLQEICEHNKVKSFWIDSADRIDVDTNTILHKMSWGELVETKEWIPAGPLKVGVTSGASTPDKAIEDVLDKLFKIKDPNFKGIDPKECAPMVSPTH
eukprot:CAMPEP_0174289644 /NCGR_PEP_ID=MMETSP0809-20121228/25775_1 /TAXON_ID=73025 ORGANISM="Eutreptiella gymnastica-like, Strain CCMP1594" /NCGR_SAMPLE_ID=MMETSP0809 /ASSEMBLY_ACC=CAM_ASM_000658 /LENGTH=583 /DNA_ID=CAMNT_0015387713 /DNA_START=31 /DNA_END=1782 /DNA_ORIENTATION=+